MGFQFATRSLSEAPERRWTVLLLRVWNDAEDPVGGAMDSGNAKPSTRGSHAPKPVTSARRGMPLPNLAGLLSNTLDASAKRAVFHLNFPLRPRPPVVRPQENS
jgi:hypothetical protein